MITYDLSSLVHFPDALTEFAEDFCHDYNINDVGEFTDRLARAVGENLSMMIFASVQAVDHRLILQLTPHRRLLGDCVRVHQSMIREGVA